jgi:hypothetical protein
MPQRLTASPGGAKGPIGEGAMEHFANVHQVLELVELRSPQTSSGEWLVGLIRDVSKPVPL